MKTLHNPIRAALNVPSRASLILAALCALILPSAPATAQQSHYTDPYGQWVGEPGITEMVDQIMARDRLLTPEQRDAVTYKPWRGQDRSHLPSNPSSPAVAQWPPAPSGPQRIIPTAPGHHGGAPDNPQLLGTSFLAAQSSESGFIPPDTMGEVGPTQIMVTVNGRFKVFDKNGVLGPLNTTSDNFFASVRNNSGTSDPRVRYDRLTQRWFVSIINVSTPNRIMLAVSSGPTITGQASFTFYQFQQDQVAPAGNSNQLADYPSLGVDNNAVYIGCNMFGASFAGTSGWVIRKTSVLSGGPIVVTALRGLGGTSGAGVYTPRGVNNDDPAATEGYFIGSDISAFGVLSMRRVLNPGTAPTAGPLVQVTVPATTNPINVPAQGSTTPVDGSDDRLYSAEIRRNRNTGVRTLWTAHAIQVNASGVASTSGGRDGARWYQLGSMTSTPTLLQSGTLFDSAASSPRYYVYPAGAMSGQGHFALGASFGGAVNFMSAATAGRLSGDTMGTIQAPTTIIAGAAAYTAVGGGRNRWGDYSYTSVDPADDMTMWTIQEYCNSSNSWAVRVTKLIAPPPATPASCSPATAVQGASSVNIVLTGTSASGSGFFDPIHPDYPNAISASIGGTLVTVNSVTYTDPTHATLNVSVDGAAPTGARTITVTNPDAQSATSATGILTITAGGCTAPAVTTNPSSQTACSGGSATFTAAGSGSPAPTFQWRKSAVNIGGATGASLTINPVTAGDAGSYDCVLTNTCGSATTTAAALTVNAAPAVTTNPAAQSACTGSSATFTAAGSGTPAPGFQWRRNTVNIGGATGPSLTINSVSSGDAGSYDCVLTNICGSAATSAAALTVNTAPSVTTNPSAQFACTGGSATFNAAGSGTPAPSFQWRKNTVNIGGATGPSLTINPVGSGDAGSYDCVLSNICGSATTTAAVLIVNTAPAVTTNPSAQTVCTGGSATFTAGGSGTPTPGFQWRRNTVNIGGATGPSLTINPVGSGDAGSYDCILTNTCGSATTTAAVLTVNVAPTVTTNPSAQSICTGGSATFNAAGSGTPAPTFQWRRNAVNIPGATASSLTINPVTAGNAGSYDCVLTNTCGSATTTAAVLTVDVAPAVTTNPSSQSACTGGSITLSAAGSGTPAPSFQWRRNAVNIGGATGPSLTINPVTAGDAASYDCVLTNICGSATTAAAMLTVNAAPAVTTNPSSQSACTGGAATFTAAGSGTPAPSFQWRRNTVNIGGATGPSLTINPVSSGDAGSYDCVLTNICGNSTTTAAPLAVNAAPAVTTNPSSQSACAGDAVTFVAAGTGTPAPTFQWRRNTVNIPGATAPSLMLNPVTPADAASYDCVLTNSCGSATTTAAGLTVNGAPSVTTDPSPQAACTGGSATFTAAGSGTPAPGFQWRRNTVNIGGATGPSLTINPVAAGDAGTYDCVLTNSCGSATTTAVPLTVDSGPAITANPTDQSACTGASATFTAAGSGSPAPTFQWRKNGGDIPGAISASFSIVSVSPADTGTYDCVLTNSCGSNTTTTAALTVNDGPSVSTDPSDQTACPGGTVSFTAAGTGSPAPSFQWRKDGGNIAGATTDTYTIAPVSGSDAGSYDCILTNTCGSATTAAATLTVNTPVSFTGQPTTQTVCAGAPVTFTVAASGSPAPSFQWRKDTVPIPGATADTYAIPAAAPSDTGAYDCVAGNPCGDSTSSAASLTVDTAPSFTTQPMSLTVNSGSSATFSVSVSGGGPFTYQWRRGGLDISGAVGSSYTINPIHLSDTGSYDVVASNPCGPTTSSTALLTVNCTVDLNGDGQVNVADYLAYLTLYAAGGPSADINGDGQVNVTDYLAFLTAYSQGC
jgi:hypothetical protein